MSTERAGVRQGIMMNQPTFVIDGRMYRVVTSKRKIKVGGEAYYPVGDYSMVTGSCKKGRKLAGIAATVIGPNGGIIQTYGQYRALYGG